MKELLSVIVPVYNAELYLEQCITSILKQTYSNLELILVDDASSDGSPEICDEFAKKDSRVKVIHKESEGGAKARNVGIGQAKGKYIYFMDSDDYIDADMLENMVQIMGKEEVDLVCTSFHYVDKNGVELYWHVPDVSKYSTMSGVEAARIFLTTRDIEGFSWNKLFTREHVLKQELHFAEELNSFVDITGMFKGVLTSNRVAFYNAKPYYYRQHNVSIVHTMTIRKLRNFKKVVGEICEMAAERGLQKESVFFHDYRMILQLYDAVRDRKNYDKETWDMIEKEFAWNEIFGKSLFRVLRLGMRNLKEERIKCVVKCFCVWWNFNILI